MWGGCDQGRERARSGCMQASARVRAAVDVREHGAEVMRLQGQGRGAMSAHMSVGQGEAWGCSGVRVGSEEGSGQGLSCG